jgi:hypothetical protein
MPRRKPSPPADPFPKGALTDEQLRNLTDEQRRNLAAAAEAKARIDALPWGVGSCLFQLLLADPGSPFGARLRAFLTAARARVELLERETGLAPDAADPQQLLGGDETLKQQRKRLGKPSVGAVKQAKHRAKAERRRVLSRLKATTPPVSVSTEVTRKA